MRCSRRRGDAARGRGGAFGDVPTSATTKVPTTLAVAETGVSLTRAELARAAGLSDDELAQLEEYGLVAPSAYRPRPGAVRRRRARRRPGVRRVHAPRHRAPASAHVPRVRRPRGEPVRAGAVAVPAAAQPRGAGAHDRDTRRARGPGPPAAYRAAAPGGAPHLQRSRHVASLDRAAIAHHVRRLGREIAERSSRRGRARRRAEGRADLPGRPRRAQSPTSPSRSTSCRSRGSLPTAVGCASSTTSRPTSPVATS